MQLNMRHTLIISAVVILILGIGVVIYFLMKPSATTTPGAGLPTAGQGSPSAGQPGVLATAPNTPAAIGARLVKISTGPVVPGEVIRSSAENASSSPEAVVSYIDRQSGNVYTYSSAKKTTKRTSNKTLPGIQSASWLPDASLAFVRYLSGSNSSTINTYGLPANGVGGFFLSQNLADIGVSASNILSLASGVNGSIASLSNIDGSRPTQIFTTPLSSIRLSYAGKGQYLVFTKPSASLPGNAYLVDSAGNFSRVFGPQSGLVALASPSGRWVLVSYALDNTLQMVLVDTATREALSLPVATIADKCVWTADESVVYCGIPTNASFGISYPDDWYQGVAHFSDRIWKIQVSGRYAQLVLDFPTETKETLDAEALAVDSQNSLLVFVNKNDGALWGYSL